MAEHDDRDDLERSYRNAAGAMDDAAARERRRAAVLAAVANLEAPSSQAARPAAANEPRWNSRRLWWQGTAAVFVVALSTVVVLRIGEQDSRMPDAQEPVSASKPAPETRAPPTPVATPSAEASPKISPDFDRSAARSRTETGAQPTATAAAAAAAKPAEPPSPAALGESVGTESRRAPAPVAAPSAFPGAAAPSGKLEAAPDAAVDALAKANKSASVERAQGAPASAVPEGIAGGQPRSAAEAGSARLITTPAAQPLQDSARSSTGSLQGASRDARLQSAQEIISAVEAGDIAAVRRLLDSGQPVDARDPDGRTALTHAVLRSDTRMVSVLIARGANPRAADKSGRTPLDYASEANSSAVLEALGHK